MENIKGMQLLDYKVSDKVYVYKKELFKDNFIINKAMIGEIIDLKQKIYEDYMGVDYLEYTIIIELKNGKQITIQDENTKTFFRKYEFISLKELQQILENSNSQLKESLQIISDIAQ